MELIYIKIIAFLITVLWFILIAAYVDLRRQLRWYKKQFASQPRVKRWTPKTTWQQRFINTLLFMF